MVLTKICNIALIKNIIFST